MNKNEGLTVRVAEFISKLEYDNIPKSIIEEQKLHLLDGIGNGLYGSTVPMGKMIVKFIKDYNCGGESTIWGSGFKASCLQAALANGSFSNVGELEDGHGPTKFKPNTIIVPAGISVAEKNKNSGKELITALIVGTEIAIRTAISTHAGKEGYARGWIVTSAIGPVGASITTSKLLNLNVDQIANAITLAGGQPCGIWSGGLTMSKRLLIGRAAENGIFSALMAKEGFWAGNELFEAEWGSLGSIISSIFDSDQLLKGLGEIWKTSEVLFNRYPTKGSISTGISAMLEILRKTNIKYDNIDNIIFKSNSGVISNKALRVFPPKDFWEAQNSVPFILAVTAYDGACGLEQFQENKIKNPHILNLAKKVKMVLDDELDKLPASKPAIVEVVCKDGKTYSEKCVEREQLNKEQVYQKFKKVALGVVEDNKINKIIELVDNLEELKDVGALTTLLR